MTNPQDRVHQVVFRWAEVTLTGNRGVGPVASSMAPADTDAWRSRLDREIWAAARPGLSYLAGDGIGVVVHKLPVKDNNDRPGSTLTHVLIGPAAALTTGRALGLVDWYGWFREGMPTPGDGRLPPLDAARLAEEADLGLRSLRRRAREIPPGPIEQLARAAMADPATPLSVLGAQLPVPEVVCGLVDLLGPAYEPWTFATAETADDGAARPRLIFLDEVPDSVTTRPRLSLSWDPPGPDGRERFLALYADAYRRDSLRAIGPVRPRSVLAKPREIAAWERGSVVAPGVLRSPYSLLHRAGRGDVTEPERDYLDRPQVAGELAELLPRLSAAMLTGLLQDWGEGGGAEEWPALAEHLVEHALTCVVGVPGAPAELTAATVALTPGEEAVHRAVGRSLAAARDWPPDQRVRHRIALLADLSRLRVPLDVDNATVVLVLSGLPTTTLIEQITVSTPEPPRIPALLLGELSRRRVDGSDGEQVYAAMRRAHLLVPVLRRIRTPAEVMYQLSGLLGGLFAERAGEAGTIRYLVGDFDGAVPAPVLGAFRLLATTQESVSLVDELALRQLYAADGIAQLPVPRARAEPAPAPPAAPRGGPAPAPAPAGPVVAAAVDEPADDRALMAIVAGVLAVLALTLIAFMVLKTYR
ncbi:hypothetical protein [Actinoplanes sp. NPDC049118]|uniref:hypothetical protein n=1 Tax=Actinoplanes sp. NPDC049118 TaxID=3155769 RepID=UPI003402B2C8